MPNILEDSLDDLLIGIRPVQTVRLNDLLSIGFYFPFFILVMPTNQTKQKPTQTKNAFRTYLKEQIENAIVPH